MTFDHDFLFLVANPAEGTGNSWDGATNTSSPAGSLFAIFAMTLAQNLSYKLAFWGHPNHPTLWSISKVVSLKAVWVFTQGYQGFVPWPWNISKIRCTNLDELIPLRYGYVYR